MPWDYPHIKHVAVHVFTRDSTPRGIITNSRSGSSARVLAVLVFFSLGQKQFGYRSLQQNRVLGIGWGQEQRQDIEIAGQ